ncbi:hypothetical protein J4727_17735 [Providencia rettgeri]|uniref:Uncharacterized protein n=1 Tax=Providencia rettgeri TaxID=587 RepID=A0A939NC12_PRORE|nr:hypothetical protein [Providencia rettgeri]
MKTESIGIQKPPVAVFCRYPDWRGDWCGGGIFSVGGSVMFRSNTAPWCQYDPSSRICEPIDITNGDHEAH